MFCKNVKITGMLIGGNPFYRVHDPYLSYRHILKDIDIHGAHAHQGLFTQVTGNTLWLPICEEI